MDADTELVSAAATTAAFSRFYVMRTQKPSATDMFGFPAGTDIAVVVDCTNVLSTKLQAQVRAFVLSLPSEFEVRATIHATEYVYVITVTRTTPQQTTAPFTPPPQFTPPVRAPAHANRGTAQRGGDNAGPVYNGNGHHASNGRKHKLMFKDMERAVKNVERFVNDNPDALEHDDETLMDYAVGTPVDGGWDELEVTFHSDRHNIHVTYFVTFASDLTVETMLVSPTYECASCHAEWNDAHPEPPL